MQSCINFGTCLVEGRVPKACSSRVQKHVSVVSKVLRLTWPLERVLRCAFNQKKVPKLMQDCARGVPRARLIKDRAGGRRRRRRQRQAGGRARRGPEPWIFIFPAPSCIQTSSFFRKVRISSSFYSLFLFFTQSMTSRNIISHFGMS
jgi:hypothetical protein